MNKSKCWFVLFFLEGINMRFLLANTGLYVGLIIGVILLIALGIFIGLLPVSTYFRALLSNAHLFPHKLIGMRLRKINYNKLVDNYIVAKKAGVNVDINDLETHYMAGGNIDKVVEALVTAKGANIPISISTAKAIDLANRDILKAVQSCVTPVVITSPATCAVARDGIELKVKVRVTVRTNIERLIGGAGEDTILARIGEGIVTTVGSANTHSQVLENPDIISKTIFKMGLDKGTAFDIISIDIADVDVGKNIGAKLLAERADADMQIANSKAEERRAMAIAIEQEMRAKTQEMRARLVDAESEVPKAISVAFRSGQLGVMDYYRMQNIIADTSMRNSLGEGKKMENN